MSSGRTNAAAAGGAEPEFFALSRNNFAYDNNSIVITAPKPVKTVCGFACQWYSAGVMVTGYPCSKSVSGPYVATTMSDNGTVNTNSVQVDGNKISFESLYGVNSVVGGYCCYIPE